MSRGNWSASSLPVRPGMYNNFKTAATLTVTGGSRGIVAMPVRADWGPVGEIVTVSNEADLTRIFGTGGNTRLVKRCLTATKKYKPRQILVYRLATAKAKAAVYEVETVGKFVAKYTGARGNDLGIEITANVLDESKVDVKVYEGSSIISSYTVEPTGYAALKEAMAADTEGLVDFVPDGEASGELSAAGLTKLTGGDSGTDDIKVADYTKAQTAFESRHFNTICLDGVTDTETLSLFVNWIARLRTTGTMVQLVVGGSADDDKDIDKGNKRSRSYNAAGIVNVVCGVTFNGETYSSAETACQIAGAIAACALNDSLTYKELADVDDLTVKLSKEEIETAIKAGSLILTMDIDDDTLVPAARIEYAINTLTTYGEDEGEKSSKIKTISTIDAIDYDLGNIAHRRIIGNMDNDADGQAVASTLLKAYLETLVASGAVSPDILVETSAILKSEGDKWFVDTTALTVDKIERIFNTVTY